MTEKLDPYKRHTEKPLTTLIRLVDHYERTPKPLPSSNLDSQIKINLHKLLNLLLKH